MATELVLGVVIFTSTVLVLVLLIVAARAYLVGGAVLNVKVNHDRAISANFGDKLHQVLARANLFIPSACGGRGTCGQCRVKVVSGGGAALPIETSHLSKRDIERQQRLACQVTVRHDLSIELPQEILGVRKWPCTVRHNRNVSTYIKELVLDIDGNETMDFRAGSYIQVECAPHEVRFADFDIESPFDQDWRRMRRHVSRVRQPVTRAYSLANAPAENDIVMLNVRIALPPGGDSPKAAPGAMSSFLFSLQPGDSLDVYGPFGDFFVRDGDAEMVFVGGGAGMAPLRSQVLDQFLRLRTTRKISFWYGARSRRELFYADLFERLAAEHDNFSWHVALSEPLPGDDWRGDRGFIHRVLHDRYLAHHPAPDDCEYYLCGPTAMINAVGHMLDDLGVPEEAIRFDDFGS